MVFTIHQSTNLVTKQPMNWINGKCELSIVHTHINIMKLNEKIIHPSMKRTKIEVRDWQWHSGKENKKRVKETERMGMRWETRAKNKIGKLFAGKCVVCAFRRAIKRERESTSRIWSSMYTICACIHNNLLAICNIWNGKMNVRSWNERIIPTPYELLHDVWWCVYYIFFSLSVSVLAVAFVLCLVSFCFRPELIQHWWFHL